MTAPRWTTVWVWVALGVWPACQGSPALGGSTAQGFPAKATTKKTRWRVTWGLVGEGRVKTLVIQKAKFVREEGGEEIQVLGDCRLAEVLVSYSNTLDILDIKNNSLGVQLPIKPSDLGPDCLAPALRYDMKGAQVTGEDEEAFVAAEVHDDQVRWRMTDGHVAHRGECLQIWSGFSAHNYRYLILYVFRDDGTVGFRVGATGSNQSGSLDNDAIHWHTAFWRVHLDLGDPTALTYLKVDSRPSGGTATTTAREIGREKRFRWGPTRFTRLRIENRNEPTRPGGTPVIGYELHSPARGSVRKLRPSLPYTHHEFGLTRWVGDEVDVDRLHEYADGESLAGERVTVWHATPFLHIPRLEDFGKADSDPHEGAAVINWTGFDLVPRNFFPGTPLKD